MVVVWALVMGTAMCVVQAANININWLINCIGIFAGGAVPPLLCVLTWRGATGRAAIPGECLVRHHKCAAWRLGFSVHLSASSSGFTLLPEVLTLLVLTLLCCTLCGPRLDVNAYWMHMVQLQSSGVALDLPHGWHMPRLHTAKFPLTLRG